MEYRISSGQTSTGITLGAEDTMTIFNHGVANSTTVESGGLMMVSAGGSAIVTRLNNGFMNTEMGAYIQSVTIGSEGALLLFSKVSVADTIRFLDSGGIVHVYSGAGKGVHYDMHMGGKVYVHDGGFFESTSIRDGNSAIILSGGTASGAKSLFSGNLILSGGTAINTEVVSGGVLTISRGGVNSKATIGSSGSAIVKSGCVTCDDNLAGRMIVSSGGTTVRTEFFGETSDLSYWHFGSLSILHGGVASDIRMNGGGTVIVQGVLSSAAISATSHNGSCYLYVSSGGRAYDVVAESTSVTILVHNRGLLSGATLRGGSELTVFSGGTATNVSAAYSDINLSSGGILSSASVTCGSCSVSGGTAIGVGIGDVGFMHLAQGEVRSSVVSGGFLHISGGSAVQTTIVGGFVHMSGGIADGVGFGGVSGILHVSNGSATNVSVTNTGFAYVYYSGRISGADVNRGTLVVSGGRAENVRISSGFAIVSHGILDTTAVFSGGSLVASGGSVTGATVLSGGYARMDSTASADSVSVSSGGTLFVGSDASCTGISAGSGARLILYAGSKNAFAGTSGGRAFAASSALVSGLSVCRYTALTVAAGASAADCDIFSSGGAVVSALGDMSGGSVHYSGSAVVDGGQARAVSVLSGGSMVIKDKGTVRQIDVNGSLYVSSGGYANNVSIHSSGTIIINKGGSATAVKMDEGARFLVSLGAGIYVEGTSGGSAFEIDGEKLSGFSLRNGTINVSSGASMVQGAVGNSAQINVSDGGFVSGITVSSGGFLFVWDVSSLNSARVLSGGSFRVGSKASAVNVVLESGAVQSIYLDPGTVLSGSYAGSAFVLSGGVVSAYDLHEGYLGLASGGSADRVTIHSGGTLNITSSAAVTNATVSSGGMLSISCSMDNPTGLRTASGVTVRSGGILYLNEVSKASSGYTSATGISADSGARIRIYDFNSMTYLSGSYGGSSFVIKDGLVSGYTVHSGGMIGLSSGCSAQAIAVESGGSFYFSGGTVSGLTCDEGAYLELYLSNEKTFSGTYAGSAFAFQNGFISSYQVHSGQLVFYSGCSANRIDVLDGGMFLIRDASVGQTTVGSGGMLYISSSTQIKGVSVLSGGIVTGEMNLTSASNLVVSSGGIVEIDFALVGSVFGYGETIVNDLSRIQGAPRYALRLSNYDEAPGEYVIAKNAAGFKETITVTSYDRSRELGTLTVGGSSLIKNRRFELRQDGGDLVLSVSCLDDSGTPAPAYTARGDRDGNGVSDVMFVWTGKTYAHGYWMNGTSDWWSANAPGVSPDWDNLGSYDMNGDGKADAVMFGNVIVNDARGAYIGYYQDGNDMDGWVTIGFLDNSENVAWQNKVGNLTGGAANSIAWYAPDLYALGAWKDGTTEWVTLSSDFGGDAWTLVGCGDFDGDGKDSVLMMYNSGQLFYVVGIDGGAAQSIGSTDWRGWEIRAIGDFAGDGKDDIVLFHHDTGSMVMCADGNLDSYESIGQLAADDWFVVGAGDYDGDAQDDLLVRQKSTGMLGYYASGIQDNWNVLGYGVDMDWTVIA